MKNQAQKYKRSSGTVDGGLRRQLIMDYSPLVKYVAQSIIAKLPSTIDVNDLISVGLIGLMDAIDKYDPARENKFKTYAEYRIRGAMLDELRRMDHIPRSIREKIKQHDRAVQVLEQRLGRKPSSQEIADTLNVNIETLQRYMNSNAEIVYGNEIFTIDTLAADGNDRDAAIKPILARESAKKLASLIDTLSEKERLTLSLYYYEGLTLREIGGIMGVTESRVSQLHHKALTALRNKLKTD